MARPQDRSKRQEDSTAKGRPSRAKRPRRSASEHSELGERLIAGVPARIMRPRIVFLCCLGAILAFGLLMVYSASAVMALSEYGDSTYFLVRQAGFIAFGCLVMFGISRIPLSSMRTGAVWVLWIGLVLLLLLVLLIGEERGGATRWIKIAGQQFQPSEFGKSIIVVTTAKVFYEYYDERSINTGTFLGLLATCVLVPLLAVFLEPDLGSCIIIGGTVFAMCYFAGFSYRLIVPLLVVTAVLVLVLILTSSYRSARLFDDPWADPYGDGYQAVLAIMAFASGGLFGRGIGNSTMKYNYLPEAHNDYILAIIGEELGFVGLLMFIAVYALMVYAAFKIAEQAPTFQGRLIASGSAVIIMLQFLVNALGILDVLPMTGKTMPFISYGGSSMLASLMVAGLVWAVSRSSNERTEADDRRDSISVVTRRGTSEPARSSTGIEGSTAGEPTVRSRRGASSGFTVVSGFSGDEPSGPAPRRSAPRSGREAPRDRSRTGGPYGRTTLGENPADRLRSQGPRKRYSDDGPGRSPRTRHPRGRGRDDR